MPEYHLMNVGATTANHVKKSTLIANARNSITISPFSSNGDVAGTLLHSETAEERENRKWEEIIARPESQSGLSRRATQLRKQLATGTYEEGGFAVE